MNYTDYGRTLADRRDTIPDYGTGASAHAAACGHDSGLTVLLTGHDNSGRRFTRTVGSVFAAHMTAHAMWGVERAWHIRPDGTRRLVFRR